MTEHEREGGKLGEQNTYKKDSEFKPLQNAMKSTK